MTQATTTQQNNFKMFLHTVNTLKNSQGFYSRLANTIDAWTEEQREQAENYFNNLPLNFKTEVDVILFLEQ